MAPTFLNTAGSFTVTSFFTDDTTTTTVDESTIVPDKVELVGTSLITVDSKPPRLASGGVITGIAYSTSMKKAVGGTSAKANSILVRFQDDGKLAPGDTESGRTGPDNAGSGLDPDSVVPSAFAVSGNTVTIRLRAGQRCLPDPGEQPGPG